MKLNLPLVLFTGLLACSSVLPRATIGGVWGGYRVEMTGTASSFRIELSCAIAELDHPAELTEGGGFDISGKVTAGSVQNMVGTAIRAVGTITADTMVVDLTTNLSRTLPPSTTRLTLVKGVRGDWSEGRICIN